jgi:hypothetical protein
MAEETKPQGAQGAANPPPPEKKEGGPSALMREALGRYGIKPQHVAGSKDYGDRVVIVTKGGAKVSFTEGDEVAKLSDFQLTGAPAPKPKKK